MKSVCKFAIVFILGCTSTFVIILSVIGPGKLDWEYKLPNDYEVWHINSNEILINYVGSEQQVEEISSFVKEFAYDERYVFSRNVKDISSNDIFEEIYYMLDAQEKKVYGPFESIEELQKQADELGVEIPKRWYRTSPDPNMSK